MEVVVVIYIIASLFFMGYILYGLDEIDDWRVYHLILATIFLPVTLVFILAFIVIFIFEIVSSAFTDSKLRKFLNKKIF